MRWLERLAAVRTNRTTFYASGAETAGERAEEEMFKAVRRIIDGSEHADTWRVWPEVRIRDGKWRSEIDLIVATDRTLYLLELKNWSGRLDVHEDVLVQYRRHQGGMIEHGNLMKTMRKREAAIRAWLTRHRCPIPTIERRVLFYNPRLEFSDAVFAYFGEEVSSASEWLSSFERLAQTETPPPSKAGEMRLALHSAIDALSTWDWVEMHGGRMVRGDIRSSTETIQLPSGKKRPLHDRAAISHIDIDAPRSYLRALFNASVMLDLRVVLRDGAVINAALPIETTMRIHAAGQSETELVALRHVRRLRFGSRGV